METIASLAFANKYYFVILTLPCLSYMLYDWFQKGMIFEFYGNWIFKEDYHNAGINEKQDALRDQIKNSEPGVDVNPLLLEIDILQTQKIPTPYYKKPLGNCLKCFHVWIVIIFSLIFVGLGISILKFLISLSISYHILVKKYF